MTQPITPIYLDYAATTPVDPRVAAIMMQYLTMDSVFGNAASQHVYGLEARDAVEVAREQVAALIGALPSEIIFTSGATESDNLAIKGAAHLYQRKGRHIVTLKTEHKAVLDSCQQLEKEGFAVTYLTPDASGRLDLDVFRASLRADTTLVSIMHVNNEIGVIQDLTAIAAETSSRGILLHVDAAQSVGKIPLDVSAIPIDLLSLAAHKIYGPKGAGVLYLRKKPRVRVEPLFHGGGHEQGMRSGTLPVHQIAGMGAACEIARQEREQDFMKVHSLNEQFYHQIKSIKNLSINGEHAICSPYILNLRFNGMLADALIKQLPEMAVSTASACQGKGTEGSYVLRALGMSEDAAKSSIRFSFGRFTTLQEIGIAAKAINHLFS
jgi:cysteine desulfurase